MKLNDVIFRSAATTNISTREISLTTIFQGEKNETERTQSVKGKNHRRDEGRHHFARGCRCRPRRRRHGVDHQRSRGGSWPEKGRRCVGGHQGLRRDDRQVIRRRSPAKIAASHQKFSIKAATGVATALFWTASGFRSQPW